MSIAPALRMLVIMRFSPHIVTVTAAASLAAAPGAAAAAELPAAPSRAALMQHADSVVKAGVPGVVLETRDERGRRALVAGVGDLHASTPPRADGRFRIGSVSKSFTATLVLRLVADGRIRLDAPVSRYLPRLLPYRRPITVRQLLEHRSGLFDYEHVVWPSVRAAARRRARDYAPAQLVGIATRRPLQFPPGSRFLYSNTDYVVLGLLVEKVTGHSYARELARRVLRPAGLKHTHLAGHDSRLQRPAARGYERLGGRFHDLTRYDMSVAWASGSIVSTAADVNRFYAALLEGRLLPARLLAQMEHSRPAFPGFGYGLGLGHAVMCGQQVWGHVGGVPGFSTYSFTSPRTKRQITVSVNRGLTLGDAAENAIMALVATEFCGDAAP
jgi:D-alanyl-D-alanine carboxypeptidase